jgi:hypothetical protein
VRAPVSCRTTRTPSASLRRSSLRPPPPPATVRPGPCRSRRLQTQPSGSPWPQRALTSRAGQEGGRPCRALRAAGLQRVGGQRLCRCRNPGRSHVHLGTELQRVARRSSWAGRDDASAVAYPPFQFMRRMSSGCCSACGIHCAHWAAGGESRVRRVRTESRTIPAAAVASWGQPVCKHRARVARSLLCERAHFRYRA